MGFQVLSCDSLWSTTPEIYSGKDNLTDVFTRALGRIDLYQQYKITQMQEI